jgi:hypothetical protein
VKNRVAQPVPRTPIIYGQRIACTLHLGLCGWLNLWLPRAIDNCCEKGSHREETFTTYSLLLKGRFSYGKGIFGKGLGIYVIGEIHDLGVFKL